MLLFEAAIRNARLWALPRELLAMHIPTLIHQEVMQHLALYGCVKNMDPFALHMLKHSEDPLMRFTRDWMRRTALKQHLDAERRQVKYNEKFRQIPRQKGASIQQTAVVDPQLSAEMLHYNKEANWSDRSFIGAVRAEAPKIFPQRDIS